MRSILTATRVLIAAALSLAVLTACSSTGPSTGPALVLTPGQAQSVAEELDTAWVVSLSLADTYAVLRPEAAPAIERARTLAEPIVQAARVQIFAAAGDVALEQRALQAGLTALAIFRQQVIAARTKAGQ